MVAKFIISIIVILFLCWIGYTSGKEKSQDPSPLPIPESWQLIAKSQNGEIQQVAVSGEYVAWLEARVDPKSIGCVCRECWFDVYRKRLDSNEIETLTTSDKANNKPHNIILGASGLVAENEYGRHELYIPGHKPITFTGASFFDAPYSIYSDAIICHIETGIAKGVSIIPLKNNYPDFENRKIIVTPVDEDKIDYGGSIFWNSNQVLYRKEGWDNALRQMTYISNSILYDTTSEKILWTTDSSSPIGLDKDYAYLRKENIIRFSINDPSRKEQLILPYTRGFTKIISFSPPDYIIYVVPKNMNESYLSLFDITKGVITEYDIQFNKIVEQYSAKERWWDLCAGDASTKTVIVNVNNCIYKVPPKNEIKMEKASFGWRFGVNNK